MTTFSKKIAAAATTGTMLFTMTGSAFANTVEISGNGASSDSSVQVNAQNQTSVVQNNTANVSNKVSASSNTGSNNANQNTNGDTLIKTGDAQTQVDIQNVLNSNKANVDCCSTKEGLDVTISGNGAKSDNAVKVNKDSTVDLFQTNDANVNNKVDADATTGKNNANQNTGGATMISTGDAVTVTSVSTMANANQANVGGAAHVAGDTDIRIIGNGYDSDNHAYVNQDNATALVQNNVADVWNSVWADAKTGKNSADQNTGDETLIYTGDAVVDTSVDNMVNFNWADVNCGCEESDLLVKIAGNGTDSYNKAKVNNDSAREIFQDNAADLDNHVDGDADTGYNHAKQSTGSVNGDPAIWTGDSYSQVEVENTSNANTYGAETPAHWPTMNSNNMNVHFSFSLSDLLAWMGN